MYRELIEGFISDHSWAKLQPPCTESKHEMLKRNLWNFEVEIDETSTADWYAAKEPWGCECEHCRNFLELSKHNRLPEAVHAILKELNIAPEKATYVCEIMSKDNGHLYQFSYRIAGRILNEDTAKSTVADWGEVRCCHEIYHYGAPGFPTPHFDLEFWVTLPWVLELKDIENAISELVMDLKPAPEPPADYVPFESIDFDRSEKDNTKWIELIRPYLNTAK